MVVVYRPAGRKRRKDADYYDDLQDRYDGRDPQIPLKQQWRFVPLGDRLPDPASDYDEAAEAPEPDPERVNALRTIMRNALSEQERYVLLRCLAGDTYAAVARSARPRLRDAAHAH